MNLSSVEELKSFLKNSHLRPKDYLGQNFLVDEEILQGIMEEAEIKPTDLILEVGPGLGTLTEELLKRGARITAIEKDEKLIPILNKNLKKYPNAKIISGDILRFNLSNQISGSYKVVANIPYYLTSKLFQYFLEQKNKPESLILMVQKEVGERVTATAGELSILGISVQVYADAEIILDVPKTSFWPVPEVDSVVLKIIPKLKYPNLKDEKLFFRILKIAFAGKRKQIHNTLASGLKLSKEEVNDLLKKAGIEPTTRPQDVSIDQWIELSLQVPNYML
ncbi:MAG TPA: 16S rRNA (adenine(1518)-N(6)/adenine(1519)-N(6))-dimethyltransferase RsmA [Methylomirabilota bacterium]|nr:16S rRNA (adenine(1518)-N(6)/adenine(1519)-N(6))-dimethyltransferase RsmA [Methylomirabilota bacterium]